jgi:TP901 family phage tail tape measure protein
VSALEVASLYATLSLNDTMTRGLRDAGRGVDSFGQRMQRVGNSITGFGAGMSQAFAPVTDFLTSGVEVAGRFEASMNEIAARTGIAGDELDRVRELSLQMGADTAFSAQQASDAMLQLLSSGQSLEEAMATLPVVLDAAAASGMDLGVAADSVTDIMAMFGLAVNDLPPDVQTAADAMGLANDQMEAWADGRAPELTPMMNDLAKAVGLTSDELAGLIKQEDAADVVDNLVRAAGASSATVQDLSDALVNVGTSANLFGMNSKETIAALAVLAENGIKGADAGTKLNSMLTQMSSAAAQGAWDELGQSMYDAQGNVKDFDTIITDLDRAFEGLPMEDQIRLAQDLAGTYGKGALLALLNADGIGAMDKAMGEAADAASVAGSRMSGWNGANDALQGSIETLQIQVLTPFLENVLTPIVKELTNLVNQVTEWATKNPELANTLIAILAVGALLLLVAVPLGIAINAAATAFTAMQAAAALIGGTMMGTILPILAVGAAIAAVIQQVEKFNALVQQGAGAAAAAAQANGITADMAWNETQAQAQAQFGGPLGYAIGSYMYGNIANQMPGGVFGSPGGASDGSFFPWAPGSEMEGTGPPTVPWSPIQTGSTPGRAMGGPVIGGSPYLVGERGPELFVPSSSGRIVPNDRLGGGGQSVVVYVNNYGSSPYEFAELVERSLRDRGL